MAERLPNVPDSRLMHGIEREASCIAEHIQYITPWHNAPTNGGSHAGSTKKPVDLFSQSTWEFSSRILSSRFFELPLDETILRFQIRLERQCGLIYNSRSGLHPPSPRTRHRLSTVNMVPGPNVPASRLWSQHHASSPASCLLRHEPDGKYCLQDYRQTRKTGK